MFNKLILVLMAIYAVCHFTVVNAEEPPTHVTGQATEVQVVTPKPPQFVQDIITRGQPGESPTQFLRWRAFQSDDRTGDLWEFSTDLKEKVSVGYWWGSHKLDNGDKWGTRLVLETKDFDPRALTGHLVYYWADTKSYSQTRFRVPFGKADPVISNETALGLGHTDLFLVSEFGSPVNKISLDGLSLGLEGWVKAGKIILKPRVTFPVMGGDPMYQLWFVAPLGGG